LFWFNPAVRILKRELRDIHEYEADKGVIQSGVDAIKYQLLLIKKAAGSSSYALANSLNHSKIKKRITMMLKKESSKVARMKTLIFVPLVVASLYAFAQPKRSTMTASVEITADVSMVSDLMRVHQLVTEKGRILRYTTADHPFIKRLEEGISKTKVNALEKIYDYIAVFSPENTRDDIANSIIIQCDTITEGEYLQCRLIIQLSTVELTTLTPFINESGFVRKMNKWVAVRPEKLPTTIQFRTPPGKDE
jgi:hypothetical protein